jgi:hypothetical protein
LPCLQVRYYIILITSSSHSLISGALIINRAQSHKRRVALEDITPKDTLELQNSLRHFVSFIPNQKPAESFYGNWRIIGETIFHPNHLIEAIDREGELAERSIRIVMRFMGFGKEVFGSPDLSTALKKIHKRKHPCSFDDDRFTELLFKVVDLDGSGTIEASELKEMVQSFVITDELKTKELELFHGFDKQKRGRLNMQEFQDWWAEEISHQLTPIQFEHQSNLFTHPSSVSQQQQTSDEWVQTTNPLSSTDKVVVESTSTTTTTNEPLVQDN